MVSPEEYPHWITFFVENLPIVTFGVHEVSITDIIIISEALKENDTENVINFDQLSVDVLDSTTVDDLFNDLDD